MTPSQFKILLGAVRQVDERVQAVEERLAYEFPTDREIIAQVNAEVDSILAPGGGIRVFADD
jgi:hypothetical protein